MTQGQLSKSQQDIKTPEALTCKLESPKQQNVRLRDESRALSRDRCIEQCMKGLHCLKLSQMQKKQKTKTERLKNCSRLKEATKTGQLNAQLGSTKFPHD